MTIAIKRNYLSQYQRAKQSDQLKTAFLANLSHEVRTPLNVVCGFTSMLSEMDYTDEDLQKIHKVIEINGKQLLFLIEDIIDLSKLEINQLELYPGNVDLRIVFERLKHSFEHYVALEREDHVEINYQLDLQNPVIWADEARIIQIV